MARPSEQQLHALGAILRARREQLGRPQDLRQWGGPSDFTVRGLEQADGNVPRAKTRRQLEVALNYPDGIVDRVLSGEITEDAPELDQVVVRDTWVGLRPGEAPSLAAFFAQPSDEEDEDAAAELRDQQQREEFEVAEGTADASTRRRVAERARGRRSAQHLSATTIPVANEAVAEALRGEGFAVYAGDTLTFAPGAAEGRDRAVTAVQRAVEFRASGPLADALSALYRLPNPTPAEWEAIVHVQQALDAVQKEKQLPQQADGELHQGVPEPSLRERHVVPTKGGSWQIQTPGAKRASATAATQAEAVERANEIISRGGGRVVVHDNDGKVRGSHAVRRDGTIS